jgi:uncharacterized membrane protein YphA (DoxX/SURF4 family)
MFVDETKAKTAWGPLVLRLALGVIFVIHGWTKIAGANNDWGAGWTRTFYQEQNSTPRGLKKRLEAKKAEAAQRREEAETAKERKAAAAEEHRIQTALDQASLAYSSGAEPMPDYLTLHAVNLAVAWGELAGGVALLVGFLTRLAALGLAIIQIGAIWAVTASKGFILTRGVGYEYNVALVAMCVVLILEGGGALAVDTVRRARRRRAGATTAPTQPVAAAPLP